MSLLNKIKAGARAKYKEELTAYKQKSAANKDIRTKARAVALQTRRTEAIKTAQFKEQQRGKAARTVKKSSGSGFAKFGMIAEGLAGKPNKGKRKELII